MTIPQIGALEQGEYIRKSDSPLCGLGNSIWAIIGLWKPPDSLEPNSKEHDI